MTPDPESRNADEADVVEELEGAAGPEDEEATADPDDLPWEADEADVAEQRAELPDEDDAARGDG